MPTYTPLQSVQLASSSANVIFSNIPQNYQDLVVVLSVRGTTATNDIDVSAILNEDTSSIYSNTRIYGTGSASSGQRGTGLAYLRLGNMAGSGSYSSYTPIILNIQNYSNTTTFKTTLGRSSNPDRIVDGYVNLWRSTAAVTSLKFEASSNFDTGSTFDLYGISPVAANNAQAAGGTDIFYDASYVYHVFKGSGTFTPYRNLTADYLVVAGGGGGGRGTDSGGSRTGSGGGAGGLRSTVTATGGGGSLPSALSLTANTAYTVTVGGGGAGSTTINTDGTDGSNSVFSSVTSTGGGGGVKGATNGKTGGSGSGGGASNGGTTGGAGTSNEGYAGGTGAANTAGGGGGAGAVGGNGAGDNNTGGNGGIGVSLSAFATATNTGVSNYYAGGGGGGGGASGSVTPAAGGSGGGGAGSSNTVAGVSGTANTGGGGGGAYQTLNGGSGGSGIVIVRYAR